MSQRRRRLAARALALALALALFNLACRSPGGPLPLGPAPQPTADPYAVVRQRAQAAFERGQAFLAAGDYERALVEFDAASLNDPDGRADIRAALEQTVAALRLTPTATPPPRRPTATLDPAAPPVLLAGGGPAAPAAGQTPQPDPAATPPGAVRTSTPPPGARAPTPTPEPTAALARYRHPDGSFSLGLAPGWTAAPLSGAEVGTPVAAFADPAGRATLTVSTESLSAEISPELYAARLETAMAGLPGYRSQSVAPASVAGQPAVRRVYVVAGSVETFQTVQLIVIVRRTALVFTGTSRASDFAAHAPVLDSMLASVQLGG